jgi:hypothetical protein
VNTPAKVALSLLAVPVIGIATYWAAGLASFTSYTIVPNEPLRHPCRVKDVNGTNLLMESGQIISMYPGFFNLSNQLSWSDFQVDIEQGDINGPGHFDIQQGNTNRLDIYVRRPRKNDFIRPLVFAIPLVRKTVGASYRAWVASGTYVNTSGQPDTAANRSQPIRSETNRPSVEAGSGR